MEPLYGRIQKITQTLELFKAAEENSPRWGHGRRNILMYFYPYTHETSIFTLAALHEEVKGRQTKLHPGFTMGKLVRPSERVSIVPLRHLVITFYCPY